MLDLYPIIAAIAVAVVAAVFALINRLMATGRSSSAPLWNASQPRQHGINQPRLRAETRPARPGRAFSAEQEARISSIEKRCAQKLCQSPGRTAR